MIDDQTIFEKEDRGRYRHPETVSGLPYADVEQLVFNALEHDHRTIGQIKQFAGFDRRFDLTDAIQGMLLDEKIRSYSNGSFTAYFLYEQDPVKTWLNGDNTVGAEFSETSGQPTKRRRVPSPRVAILGTNERPAVDPAAVEQLAGRLENKWDVAAALDLTPSQFARELKLKPLLQEAYDRGRRSKTLPTIPTEDVANKETEMKEKTSPRPYHKVELTVEKLEALAGRHGTISSVATALGYADRTGLDGRLKARPEFQAAFDRGVEAFFAKGGKLDQRSKPRTKTTPKPVRSQALARVPVVNDVSKVDEKTQSTSGNDSFDEKLVHVDRLVDRIFPPPLGGSQKHPSGIDSITVAEHMNFNVGSAIECLWLASSDDTPIAILEKARYHIDREIQRRQQVTTNGR